MSDQRVRNESHDLSGACKCGATITVAGMGALYEVIFVDCPNPNCTERSARGWSAVRLSTSREQPLEASDGS